LNIDACRIPTDDNYQINTFDNGAKPFGDAVGEPYSSRVESAGRWPANILFDEGAAALLDAQTAELNGESGASRFFYTAKASSGERNAGLDHLPEQIVNDGRATDINNAYQRGDTLRHNTHPTVKPIDLMRWLIRLVTPPDGLVLDPFLGSGTTGIAAHLEGRDFIGIELSPEYMTIAEARIAHWTAQQVLF